MGYPWNSGTHPATVDSTLHVPLAFVVFVKQQYLLMPFAAVGTLQTSVLSASFGDGSPVAQRVL